MRRAEHDPFTLKFFDRPALVLGGTIMFALLSLVLFRLVAPFELALSSAFFQVTACGGVELGKPVCGFFPLRESAFWENVRTIGFWGPLFVICAYGTIALWPTRNGNRKTPAGIAPAVLGLITTLVASIGLVNFVFKPLFGRPRPNQIIQFGGDGTYVLPGDVSHQCAANCSFVSGEASTAFCLIVFAALLPVATRRLALALAIAAAVLISGLRVAFGGHFLSDVVMAGWVVAIVAVAGAWHLQTARGNRHVRSIAGWLNRQSRR